MKCVTFDSLIAEFLVDEKPEAWVMYCRGKVFKNIKGKMVWSKKSHAKLALRHIFDSMYGNLFMYCEEDFQRWIAENVEFKQLGICGDK